MIGAYMSKFATLSGRGCCRFGCGLLGNIRRCRLEGIGRILQKLNSLVSEISVDFERFGYAYNVGNSVSWKRQLVLKASAIAITGAPPPTCKSTC